MPPEEVITKSKIWRAADKEIGPPFGSIYLGAFFPNINVLSLHNAEEHLSAEITYRLGSFAAGGEQNIAAFFCSYVSLHFHFRKRMVVLFHILLLCTKP